MGSHQGTPIGDSHVCDVNVVTRIGIRTTWLLGKWPSEWAKTVHPSGKFEIDMGELPEKMVEGGSHFGHFWGPPENLRPWFWELPKIGFLEGDLTPIAGAPQTFPRPGYTV